MSESPVKKVNGLLNYFTRTDTTTEKCSPSPTKASTSLLSNNDSNIGDNKRKRRKRKSTVSGDDDSDDEQSGQSPQTKRKRKRLHPKKESNKSKISTKEKSSGEERSKSQSPQQNESDSDFDIKKGLKKPRRKFASVPDGVRSISSYFGVHNDVSVPGNKAVTPDIKQSAKKRGRPKKQMSPVNAKSGTMIGKDTNKQNQSRSSLDSSEMVQSDTGKRNHSKERATVCTVLPSPAKSMSSVSSFEFEKEIRRKSLKKSLHLEYSEEEDEEIKATASAVDDKVEVVISSGDDEKIEAVASSEDDKKFTATHSSDDGENHSSDDDENHSSDDNKKVEVVHISEDDMEVVSIANESDAENKSVEESQYDSETEPGLSKHTKGKRKLKTLACRTKRSARDSSSSNSKETGSGDCDSGIVMSSQDSKNDDEIQIVSQDTPTRRRSSRIQKIEEQREVAKIEMEAHKVKKHKKVVDLEDETSSTVESTDDSQESSDFINDSDDENCKKKSRKKRKSKKTAGKIPLMFLKGKEREKELERLKQEKEPKKVVLDAATLAFLHSGVPDVVLKAQKQVEKKLEEDDYLSSVQFFPKNSHIGQDTVSLKDSVSFNEINCKILPFDESSQYIAPSGSWNDIFNLSHVLENSLDRNPTVFCCGNTRLFGNKKSLTIENNCDRDLNMSVPWIEKYKVVNKNSLVVDREGFSKLEKWLKQWKTDIRDDGGASRKAAEKKKKRQDSDSDFIDSEDEDRALMKKSVLLCGSTGCGKTAAVYVLAKHLGFHVVEVNFSSRRSGKEVIQKVEEATLSHRLESSESCLLLFEDIDLLHPEEDEGFHAAVAQLISASCRPIVMTTQQPMYSALDSKLEKKDPLRIYFERPSASAIVKKILLPMCILASSNALDEKLLSSGLNSLVRHVHCDVRLSINQTQLLFDESIFSSHNIHKHCNIRENFIDQDFICKPKEEQFEVDTEGSEKERKKKQIEELNQISNKISLLADLDWITGRRDSQENDNCDEITSYFDMNFRANLQHSFKSSSMPNTTSNGSNEYASFNPSMLYYCRKLTLENDDEVLKNTNISTLNVELENYCDATDDWQSWACVRTIVKTNTMSSVGRSKRNGRLACYFNRLERDYVTKICDTFGFAEELEIAKMFTPAE